MVAKTRDTRQLYQAERNWGGCLSFGMRQQVNPGMRGQHTRVGQPALRLGEICHFPSPLSYTPTPYLCTLTFLAIAKPPL